MQTIKERSETKPELKQVMGEAKALMKDVKRTLKPLKEHPAMLLKIIQKMSEPIKAEINKALEEVKKENPHFKEVYERKVNERESRRDRSVSSSFEAKEEKTEKKQEDKILAQKLREEKKQAMILER